MCSWNQAYPATGVWLPVYIKAGTRIAVRFQINSHVSTGAGGEDILMINMQGLTTNFDWANGYDNLNFVAASTSGTQMFPNATNNVKGPWSQIIASTARAYKALLLELDWGKRWQSANYLIDIGIGAAGSEVVIIPNWSTDSQQASNSFLLMPIPVAAGQRIAARLQTAGDSGDGTSIVIHGVY
jgi:hypothetical protein